MQVAPTYTIKFNEVTDTYEEKEISMSDYFDQYKHSWGEQGCVERVITTFFVLLGIGIVAFVALLLLGVI